MLKVCPRAYSYFADLRQSCCEVSFEYIGADLINVAVRSHLSTPSFAYLVSWMALNI